MNSAQPDDEIERYQIATAVWATVKMDRCARKDLAETNRRRKSAKGRWEAVHTRRVNELVESLHAHPDASAAQLETFTRGCDWLLWQWEFLAQALEKEGSWTDAEAFLALRLLGKAPEMFNEDADVASFRLNVLGTRADVDADELDKLRGISSQHLD